MRLPGFTEPDTSTDIEGYLEAGTYDVLQVHDAGGETTYHLLSTPALAGRDTWICSRWRNHVYADVETVEVREPPGDDTVLAEGLTVPESEVVSLISEFGDFTYDLDAARYPFDLPGVRVPRAPPATNNCCTFVEALLVRAWANVYDDFSWSRERHAQMMILSSDDYFSPVTAAVQSGMAVPAPDDERPPRPWTIVQGWRRRWRDGHTFLILDHHRQSDAVLTLESNSAYRLDGVGFRGIGNLASTGGAPPDGWWRQTEVWSWARIRGTYRHRRLAYLKVTDRTWVPAG